MAEESPDQRWARVFRANLERLTPAGWTRAKLAKEARISQATLYRALGRVPSTDVLTSIAGALGLSDPGVLLRDAGSCPWTTLDELDQYVDHARSKLTLLGPHKVRAEFQSRLPGSALTGPILSPGSHGLFSFLTVTNLHDGRFDWELKALSAWNIVKPIRFRVRTFEQRVPNGTAVSYLLEQGSSEEILLNAGMWTFTGPEPMEGRARRVEVRYHMALGIRPQGPRRKALINHLGTVLPFFVERFVDGAVRSLVAADRRAHDEQWDAMVRPPTPGLEAEHEDD